MLFMGRRHIPRRRIVSHGSAVLDDARPSGGGPLGVVLGFGHRVAWRLSGGGVVGDYEWRRGVLVNAHAGGTGTI